jgi:hypothetical protein
MNKLKILNENIPLFPLIIKLEGKLADVLCLKVGECMDACLENLLVCNKPCDTLKMDSKLQLVFNKILDLLGVSQTLWLCLDNLLEGYHVLNELALCGACYKCYC